MKIAFQTNQITVRGDAVAIHDYARFNEELLGNRSFIVTKRNHIFPHEQNAIEHISKRFPLFFYESPLELIKILERESADLYYTLEGEKYPDLSGKIKMCYHSMFYTTEPFGDKFAYISGWLSERANNIFPFVPHMVSLPDTEENLREQLGIPKDATVIGRYGGYWTFNLPFVFDAVNDAIEKRDDIWFLFMNTGRHCEFREDIRISDNRRAVFLPPSPDLGFKTKFINTCDAHLHARTNGEGFGMTVAEFSSRNKPVMTWTGYDENKKGYGDYHAKAHIQMLGDKGVFYNDFEDLKNILLNFKPQPEKDWNAFGYQYSPEGVMEKFESVFIK